MEISGACLCGDISWQATIDPALVGVCHCTDCQTVGGSAFQFTTRVAREDFHLTTGELTAYVKVAENGNPRAMSFCGRCATMIHTGNTDATGLLSLRLGGCKQKHELSVSDLVSVVDGLGRGGRRYQNARPGRRQRPLVRQLRSLGRQF